MKTKTTACFLALLTTIGCAPGADVVEDMPDARLAAGLAAGKADGRAYSPCELDAMLAFVNAAATDEQALRDAGVHSRAVQYIVAARSGADAVLGTADDVTFATPQQLDSVYYVGPAAFRQLAEHVAAGCDQNPEASVEVIFSPQPRESSHLARVEALIEQSTRTIDIAMYSFRDSAINAALGDAVERGVTVRMVFETARSDQKSPAGSKSAALEDLGIDVRYVNKIMHHKYAIFDEHTLVSGSANWSNGGATRFDENTVVISGHGEALARFQRQFDMMWNHSRDFVWNEALEWVAARLWAEPQIPHDPSFDAIFTSDNFDQKVTSYGNTFSVVSGRNTVSDRLVEMIEGARTSIHVASGHLRSRPVTEALIARKQADPSLDIRVYLDSQEYISAWYHDKQQDDLVDCLEAAGDSASKQQKCTERGFLFGYALHLAGIDVRYKYYAYRWHYSYADQMHHKYLIIDGTLLASGSYNLSATAEHDTLENVAIYDAAADARWADLVYDFQDNFETLWETRTTDGTYESLVERIQGATDWFPIVFEPMALDWDEVTALKQVIRDHCPDINTDSYRQEPQDHKVCEL